MEIGKPGGGFIIGSSDSFREGTARANRDALPISRVAAARG